jgi:hypothetical protein
MLEKVFAKKVAPRKSKAQLQSELDALKGCVNALQDAETSLVKTDFVFQAELDAISKIRSVLAQRASDLEDFLSSSQR